MLSQTSEYALRAVVDLARASVDGPVKLEEVADYLGAPKNYLSKTLHLLARAGVLSSGRGPYGGFQLAIPPRELTLALVVAPFEPPTTLARRCLLGHGECSDTTPCEAHERWKAIAVPMRAFFLTTTVGDLISSDSSIPGTPFSSQTS